MRDRPDSHAVRRALEETSMQWSVVVQDARSGAVLIEHHGGRVLHTASIGKLLLLAFAGNALLKDPAMARMPLDRRTVAPVADSGIWQHLAVDVLPMADVAKLIFVASDNLAANVLLEHFQLEPVRAFRAKLGLVHTDLLDVVRDVRGRSDPEALSRAPAAELSDFMACIVRDGIGGNDGVHPGLARWLRDGLSLSMDLSMVPSPLGLDPLAHAGAGHAPGAASKTGSDVGVRADTGIISLATCDVAYAALCNYEPSGTRDAEVTRLMHLIGEATLAECDAG